MTTGTCRICRNIKKLTEDHVPPKGWTLGAPVLSRDFLNYITEPEKVRGKTKQNGNKFKTICGGCNSSLGSNYDPELIKLARFVTLLGGDLPKKYNMSALLKTSRIIRSVLGHLLASKTEPYDSPFDDLVHEYLMHKRSTITDKLDIKIWIYPFYPEVILRDIVIGWIPQKKNCLVHLLKFYPLGFIVTEKDCLPESIRLPKLYEGGIDELFSFDAPPLINNQGWPETPSETRFLLGGQTLQSGVYSVPKPHKKPI